MTQFKWLAGASVMAFVMISETAFAQSNTQEDIQQAQQEIWAMEQSIYASRSEGDFQPYIDGASENFIAPRPTGGWEPGKDGLRRTGDGLREKSNERLSMNFKSFTLHGDTAVIYYMNHRTMRPEGTVVDEWYEVMHVWTRDQGDWILVASMPRLVEGYEPPG